ncbi:hypothetical protein FIV42_16355 [Persicimonas caeni]|uniref:Carboxypeptidase regulatory-like domain-containing protein n=1 Tax=Persicimonas caeni TaxID=2292766 RepID=A0A4Y6PVI7_PERCE|nr:carboxypeptidase regulatory-like domain-containing protein [Persicimonas caeni]QDG52253.1 hypothetical protein FIV42_16355 [Persicimonas caeni]QED33475.1 hypothetical protein FRD00_16350 [Persicimonas caeni]
MSGQGRISRSTTLVSQALISGRVVDAIDAGAPRSEVDVRLVDRDSGESYPLDVNVRSDGVFAFFGDPVSAFEDIGRAYRLRLEASADGYLDGAVDLSDFSIPSDQPAQADFASSFDAVADATYRRFSDTLPIEGQLIELEREPVRLSLLVLDAADNSALAGASVTLDGVTQQTDAGGEVVFDPLPSQKTVTIDVSATGYDDARIEHLIDYEAAENRRRIALRQE